MAIRSHEARAILDEGLPGLETDDPLNGPAIGKDQCEHAVVRRSERPGSHGEGDEADGGSGDVAGEKVGDVDSALLRSLVERPSSQRSLKKAFHLAACHALLAPSPVTRSRRSRIPRGAFSSV